MCIVTSGFRTCESYCTVRRLSWSHFAVLALLLTWPQEVRAQDDQAASPPVEESDTSNDRLARGLSLGAVATASAGVGTWLYFSWYYGKPAHSFELNNDGWFGRHTYAGGADKMGHLWGALVFSRAAAGVLRLGRWNRLESTLIGAGLSAIYFTGIEVKDAFYYAFSLGDLVMDLLGVGIGVAMELVPWIDESFSLRVEYLPSAAFREKGTDGNHANVFGDYSGQRYLLSYHMASIEAFDRPCRQWLRFINIDFGFRARDYAPPALDWSIQPRQEIFFGLSFDVQHMFDELFGLIDDPPTVAVASERMAHWVTEYFALPYTSVRVVSFDREGDRDLMQHE